MNEDEAIEFMENLIKLSLPQQFRTIKKTMMILEDNNISDEEIEAYLIMQQIII